MIRHLLAKYYEPYRIRHGWGLSPIRNKRELKALIAFCQEELKDEEHMRLNPQRWDIYEETVRLYERQIVNDDWTDYRQNIHDYIRDHSGWYWN